MSIAAVASRGDSPSAIDLQKPSRRSRLAADFALGKSRHEEVSAAEADHQISERTEAMCFGPFCLFPGRRLLLRSDKPVSIGSRAFDILTALLERPGELVTKGELITRAWPKTFVCDDNLKFQVSTLRRVLRDGEAGARYICTVTGRGYSFVAPVRTVCSSTAANSGLPHASVDRPAAPPHLIGRRGEADRVAELLRRERLVTIVGPGGIGKTALALTLANDLASSYEHGVRIVYLAALADSTQMQSAVREALMAGVAAASSDPIVSLHEKSLLLVLDNCEHVIEAATDFALAVLKSAPNVTILATSREPLLARGERVFRLRGLTCPPSSPDLTAVQALAFPAIQLLIEHAAAAPGPFELSDRDAPLAAELCRSLDGLALGIELAAAQIGASGLSGMPASSADCVHLSIRSRTRPPRQHSLMGSLDWSYALLSETERKVLCALAVLPGGFTMRDACAAAASSIEADAEMVDVMAALIAKSLVVSDLCGVEPCFHLLQTTRAYLLEKLGGSENIDALELKAA